MDNDLTLPPEICCQPLAVRWSGGQLMLILARVERGGMGDIVGLAAPSGAIQFHIPDTSEALAVFVAKHGAHVLNALEQQRFAFAYVDAPQACSRLHAHFRVSIDASRVSWVTTGSS